MVWALKTLWPYVEGTSFTVRWDHDSLKCMITIYDPHGSLARWRLALSNFEFTVTYRPGLKNHVPDALSRCGAPVGEDEEVEDDISSFGDVDLTITGR